MLGLLLLLVLVLVAALAGPASAGAEKIAFTTHSLANYTAPPERAWASGDAAEHLRGGPIEATDVSTYPLLSGTNYITENLNFDLVAMRGYGWGTYRLEVAGGGVWVGTFTEEVNLLTGMGTQRGQGHGVSGSVAGYQVKWTAVANGATWPFGMALNSTGYVIEK
jgi:hypothetical protein